MSWSFPLFALGGTVVRIHLAFFLLLAWVASVGASAAGLAGAVEGVLFILLVFACVVAHEFGHVYAARRYGIRTPDITVLPIGGLARLEKMPEKPVQELVVAVAGPAVNVAIFLVLLLFGARFGLAELEQIDRGAITLVDRLAAVNVMLVVFNMIPAFPLDGGRVFRALLSLRLDRAVATRIASWTGQGFAVLFAVAGLMWAQPLLVLIAVFMFFAADAERDYELDRVRASNHTAADAMVTRFASLSPSDTAGRAADLLLETTQAEFPVLDVSGGLAGWVTRSGLVAALRQGGVETAVRDFMVAETQSVGRDAPLVSVLDLVRRSEAGAVAVAGADGRLAGYVSTENAQELFALEAAAGMRRSAPPERLRW